MARGARELVEVVCPCCQAELKIDPETRAVISHKEKEKPPAIEDLSAAAARVKGEAARREEAFRKSVEEHKVHQQVLSRKFDELLKQAKEHPDEPPPLRDIDID